MHTTITEQLRYFSYGAFGFFQARLSNSHKNLLLMSVYYSAIYTVSRLHKNSKMIS
nr:MAG TPA: hypothetical protein [Caudoviricetes sp.]